jgi:hypothetical protein
MRTVVVVHNWDKARARHDAIFATRQWLSARTR